MNQLLVNCSVFCVLRHKTILPWTIQKIPDVELSFAEFFNQYVEGRISGIQQMDLISACAGNSKESLDEPGRFKLTYSSSCPTVWSLCQVHCDDPIERLYYSAGYAPICIYCAADIPPANASDKPDIYRQCDTCIKKTPVTRSKPRHSS